MNKVDNNTLDIKEDKLVKFIYNRQEYCISNITDTPIVIIISLKLKNNREELTNSELLDIIDKKISIFIPEGHKDNILDRYKEVLLKIEGESGIGTSNFNISEEESSFIIAIR